MENITIKYLKSTTYHQKFIELMEKLYNKYGSEIFDINGIGKQLDINGASKKFFKTNKVSDVSIDSNANVGDNSVIGYVFESSKPYHLLNSYYRLWKWLGKNRSHEYSEEIIEKQINGTIYINDFTGLSSARPYCYNYSTYDTALNGVPSEFDCRGGSKPPKNIMSFLGQQELVSLFAGNSTLGAVGLADLFIVLSIFVKKALLNKKDTHFEFKTETDCWNYVKDILVGFIYRLNQPYRGNQALFTNISLYDKNFLKKLCPDYKLEIDGIVYNSEIEIVQKIQETFINIMNEELCRKTITFPISTACFSTDENNNILDNEFLDYISEENLKFGFINIYCGKTSTLSSCCRLRSDSDNSEYFNAFGSGSTKIGSLGVCTINLPQLANKVDNFTFSPNEETMPKEKIFLSELKQLVIDCQEVNNAKRNIIKQVIKNGNHPLYSTGFMNIKTQYNTVGIVGLNEAIEILGYNILEENGQNFVLQILDVINKTNNEIQNKYKSPCNCEQVPAESLAVKLAEKDNIFGYNNKYQLYSNQFIPLTSNANLLDRLKIQGLLDGHFSGGAICHLNIEQELKDVNKMKNLIISAAKQGVVYFAINYILQECENNHFTIGNVDVCPVCQSKIINKYTRVVGFLTKVNDWNKTRREYDFKNRQFYKGIN